MSSFSSAGVNALLSNGLAAAVELLGNAVVAVNSQQRMIASGIHWRSGVIVTTDYALRREEEINITLPDGSTIPATLVGHDLRTDLAVLKLEGADFPVAEIGDASLLKVGHIVLAIGRIKALSASFGIVSAKSGCGDEEFFRLDLKLYPGFCGGPLVDVSGRVIGINILGPRRTVLSIPGTTVNRIVDQLLQRGSIVRGYLGLGMQPVLISNYLRERLLLAVQGGVIVVNVEPNSPAQKAGVTIGDVIIALDRICVSDTSEVQALLGGDRISKVIPAQIIRGGTVIELAIAVGERPNWEE